MEAAAIVNKDLSVSHGDDSNAYVHFYWNKVEEKHFMRLSFPGDNKSEWDQPVRDADKERYFKQWERYEQQLSQFGDEALIDELDFLTENQIQQFKGFNIHTVKQLAGLTDTQMNNVGMGMRDVVKKAQNWLMNEKDSVERKRLEKILSQRDDRIAELEVADQENKKIIMDMRKEIDAIRADMRTGKPDGDGSKAPSTTSTRKSTSGKKAKPAISAD